MTDVLRETLEERGRARPWEDVEALLAAGERRVRRRRLTNGAGALAAVVALAVATPYVVGAVGGDGSGRVAAAGPFAGPLVSYSDGSVVVVGEESVELDNYPEAYVLTDDAVVAASPYRTVELTDRDGTTEIGSLGDRSFSYLVADGSLVAWYDQDSEDVVVYDTAERREVRRVASPMPSEDDFPRGIPEVAALDGTDVWFATLDEIHGVDVETGEEFRTIPGGVNATRVVDAAAGRVVTFTPGSGVQVSTRDGRVVADLPDRFDDGQLSPDGTWLVGDGQNGRVTVDPTSGGEPVAFDSGNDSLAVGRWLDEDRFQAVVDTSEGAVSAGREVFLVVCAVSTRSCEPVVRSLPADALQPTGHS